MGSRQAPADVLAARVRSLDLSQEAAANPEILPG